MHPKILTFPNRRIQVVLMRVHASGSTFFDRAMEVSTFRAVSESGLGPALLLLFENGRVEEFLSSHVALSAPDLRDPDVSAALASTLASWHLRMVRSL